MRIKKRMAFAAVLTVISLTVTGCGGSFPEMSDSEYNMIVNYAAGLLLRYAKNTPERMTYLDAAYTPEHLAGVQTEDAIPAPAVPADTQPVTEPVQQPVPDAPEEAATDEPATDDAASAGLSESGAEASAEDAVPGGDADAPAEEVPVETPAEPAPAPETEQPGSVAEQPVSADIPADRVSIESSSLQRIADGATVEYTGYSVRNAYPDSQTQGAVSAAPGDKLLVVDFTIHNLTGNTVHFNTASLNPQFKLLINGDVQGFTMVTMIANDLSGMDTQIAPGGRADAVLLMEVPEDLAKSVSTLDLMVVRGADPQTIQLE